MAQVHRIYERSNGSGDELGGTLENRRERLHAILRNADRMAKLYMEAAQGGNVKESKTFRKRAHSEARMAARLIGVLEIEFGLKMGEEVGRAKKIFTVIFGAQPVTA